MACNLLEFGPEDPLSPKVCKMQSEIVALLFPEPAKWVEGSTLLVTAVCRNAQGMMELRQLRPDKSLLGKARVTGRFNSGKPILDPATREVIGYEIEPLADPGNPPLDP